MSSPYYTPSGTPATSASGSSSDVRSEFNLIETAMDLMPALTANYVITVNAGGTRLDPTQFLSVSQGGTGAASLTDGAVLLGSGTGAITPLPLTVDGAIIIGDGTTDPTTYAAFDSSTGTLKVSAGGTGASTLTDGGILLGSGTGAVTAMSVLAPGEMIVGDGATDPVAQSGPTLRTSIGVGTSDNVTFATLTSTGLLKGGDLTLTAPNPEVLGGDADGILYLSASTTKDLGGNILLYGDTHATKANDFEFRATTGVELHYDDSASTFDFQANKITTTGVVSIAGEKVAPIGTAIAHTGGGTLEALRLNQLRDSSAYTLPAANSVSVNDTILIELQDEFNSSTPVVNRAGADTITDRNGTDTSITFAGAAVIRLTSDGTSDWSLSI